jgi:EF-P beta-lysylation protein EpmB
MVIVTEHSSVVGAGWQELPPWQEALARAIRDPETLWNVLELPASGLSEARRAAESFPLLVPWEYVRRMERGNPNDPLLRQVLPLGDECHVAPGYLVDPVQDAAARLTRGLLQKYPGRVLVITTGACAVHCRYCFRRHYPYEDESASRRRWSDILAVIRHDMSLEEVILSGGDPLSLPDSWIAELVQQLAEVEHVRRLRLHTRVPIVIPQRVTDQLLDWARGTRLTTLFVVHVNHPRELDAACRTALSRLVDAGIPVLNQAVLLRGVNDCVEVLETLCRELINLRVLPYYLHQLDPVAGAHHFYVDVAEGQRLIAQLRQRLPGYAVPRYVVEIPGEPSKRVLTE